MLGRLLDESYAPQVRQRITLLTTARLGTNAAYRFALPFLATIARGFDVSLDRVAVALTLSEIGGFLSPVLGGVVDRLPRRRTMAGGLLGMAAAGYAVAAAPSVGVFSAALLAMAFAKLIFDIAMTGWIAERVPFTQRGRAIGITELAWAGGLLIGVPILGLITWATSFHVAYAVIATVLVATAVLITRLLEGDRARRHDGTADDPPAATAGNAVPTAVRAPRAMIRRLGPLVATNFTLMFAAQTAFVTMGSWLEDDYGFSAAALAAVSFGLGGGELIASSSAVRFTDVWGKQRSIRFGAMLMVPAGLGLAFGHGVLAVGLIALGLFILGFEFGVVSALPLATNLIPGRPSSGLGFTLLAGTLGRAAASVPTARLYEAHGIRLPLLVGTASAALCVGLSSLIREPS